MAPEKLGILFSFSISIRFSMMPQDYRTHRICPVPRFFRNHRNSKQRIFFTFCGVYSPSSTMEIFPLRFFVWYREKFQGFIQDFPEGGANPKEGGYLLFWPNFPENCIKMKKMGPRQESPASKILLCRSAIENYLTHRKKCKYLYNFLCQIVLSPPP